MTIGGVAASIAPDWRLRIAQQILKAAGRRRHNARWGAINRQRLILAQLCIGRALREADA